MTARAQPEPVRRTVTESVHGAIGEAAASAATYRVRSGDTLSAIAARFGTTVAVLRKLNDIEDPSLLRVGQLLRLP